MDIENFIPIPSVDYTCGFWCWFKFVIIPIALTCLTLWIITHLVKHYSRMEKEK